MKTYRIFCRYDNVPTFIGNITALNYSHACRKAQQLFNRHAYPEHSHT